MNASSTATMELEDVKVMEKEKTMHARRHAPRELEDIKVHVKLKLAALWASVMFIYLYVDVLGFFKPGVIEDILAGVVWEFEITQTWAVGALVLMTIPSLMVFLSLALPARANRWTNIVVAALYVPVSIFNVIGEAWVFYFWSAVIVEVALLALVIRYAWTWPAAETRLGSVPITSAAQPVGAADLRRQRAEMPSS
jgi:Family of unknown function (DUF6326)